MTQSPAVYSKQQPARGTRLVWLNVFFFNYPLKTYQLQSIKYLFTYLGYRSFSTSTEKLNSLYPGITHSVIRLELNLNDFIQNCFANLIFLS